MPSSYDLASTVAKFDLLDFCCDVAVCMNLVILRGASVRRDEGGGETRIKEKRTPDQQGHVLIDMPCTPYSVVTGRIILKLS